MVLRRLLVIALLALVSVAGVAATTALANTTTAATPDATSLAPASPFDPDGQAAGGERGVPCVRQANCGGGALLAGATLLLVLPASGLALPAPAPVAPVVAVPTRLRSALLASKLFRPPRALLTPA